MFHKQKYVEVAQKILERGIQRNKVVVYYDPDVDGIISGTLMLHFLRQKYNIEPAVAINTGRGHGLLDLQMLVNIHAPEEALMPIPLDYTIINVDSSIGEDVLETLVRKGYNIVSLDHHEVEYNKVDSTKDYVLHTKTDVAEGIVLNNQYTFEPQEYKFQSGAGVVLTFINQLDPTYVTNEMRALVGITLLSDSRPIEGPIARQFLETLYTFKPTEGPLINHLTSTIGFNSFSIGKPTLDRVYIDFIFSPFINALMRFNKGYETIKWLDFQPLEFDKPREIQQEVVTTLMERMRTTELKSVVILTVAMYDTDHFDASNFIGLVANKVLQQKGKTVVIAAFKRNNFYRGSVRGYYNSIDYNTAFNKMGMIARGHKGAFGLKTMNLDMTFWKHADEYITLIETKHTEQFEIINMFNLAAKRNDLMTLAYENMFRRGPYKAYVNYTGFHVETVQTTSVKLLDFNVDGLRVKSFDTTLNPRDKDVYIEPTLEKGYLKLYLTRIVL